MYVIGSVLVSDEVVSEQFACNLAACKGACCWEGDAGAPLETGELPVLEEIYDAVAPLLTEAGRAAIATQGHYVRVPETGEYATPLVNDGPCAYMTLDGTGTALCGIEQAYNEGRIGWKKPISCHLYPIRVTANPAANFESLNYDRWDICSAACARGARQRIAIYEFAKPALIRKYGAAWYAELEAAVEREADK